LLIRCRLKPSRHRTGRRRQRNIAWRRERRTAVNGCRAPRRRSAGPAATRIYQQPRTGG
jgi:hypothetical protein